uniref:Activin_recp domain-containing protein n=1 Tax=Panagrolaimus superbus TaxID=310955 RepID=A0A914Z9W9_9BILA
MQKINIIFITFLVITFFTFSSALRCYTGYKMMAGQSFGDKQKECEGSSDFCYNVTATAGILLSPMKAGCSTYRCYLSKDTCRSMEFQGVPVSFCCCSTDLCNGK